MFALNPSRTGESLAITQRRATEAHYSKYEYIKQDEANAKQRTYWEQNTQRQIERNQVAKIARGIESEAQKKLEARRRKLAALYKADEAQQKVEIVNQRETAEQKARRMVAQARKLKAAREQKRKQFAQDMYNRQWRAACDDLRHIGSERFAEHCYNEIAVQREEKVRRKQHEEREQAMWAQDWENERLKRVQAEDASKRHRQRFNHETKMALFDQMEVARTGKLKDAYEQELEREAFRKQMEEDAEFARQCQIENTYEQKRRMDEILAFNRATQQAKAEVTAIQKEQELHDLNQKLELHKADLVAQRRKKEQMRIEMQDYMAYLAQQREKMRQMELQIEKLCLAEQDRENAKKDAQWAREQAARDQLKEDVFIGRAQQLLDLQERHRQLEADLEIERQTVLAEEEASKNAEYQEDVAQYRTDLAHQQDLMRQMHENRMDRKVEEAQIIEDREIAIRNERQYRAFVQREKNLAEQQGIQIKPQVFM